MARTALITGITGQDGSYLAELLVGEGYEVVGLVRPGPADEHENLSAIVGRVRLIEADLHDRGAVRAAIAEVAPDELHHLAAPTFVPTSWEDPTVTVDAIAGGTANVLATVLAETPDTRVYVAGSSEVFGAAPAAPQDESTPKRPTSPYGVAKLAALGLAETMRARHGLHVSVGLTYNHESPRRPLHFLSRKVTRGAAAIALGQARDLALGDLGAIRDWSHALDVVRAGALMVRQDEPDDYVIASGIGRTVGDLVAVAWKAAGLENPEQHVRVDPRFVRPPEPVPSVGNPGKARAKLGWTAATSFDDLITEMVERDLAILGG